MPNWKPGRFGLLLTSLVSLLVLTPFSELVDLDVPRARVLYSFVLLAGIHSLRRTPWAFRAGLFLVGAALLTSWLTQRFNPWPLVLADLAGRSRRIAIPSSCISAS